jgi:hypothetical protein
LEVVKCLVEYKGYYDIRSDHVFWADCYGKKDIVQYLDEVIDNMDDFTRWWTEMEVFSARYERFECSEKEARQIWNAAIQSKEKPNETLYD